MRKLSYFAALVVAMVAVSCAKEIDAPVADSTVKFTASFDASASKAVLKPGAEESKVEWEAGDQVSVLAAGANYLYAAQTPGASTTLATEATDVPAEGPYYAVYPYDADATLAEGVITTELPAEQTAVLGSFSTHLAVAQAAGTKLAFKNVCGLVKVNVSAENVTKVVFEGNSGEIVAGAVNVTVADAPTWTAVAEQGAASVTLAAASGTLAKGDYYFAVLPQTFAAGFKVTAYKGESASVIRNVASEVTIARADIVAGKSFGIEGQGTEAAPYIIMTAQDMVDMRSLAKLGGETWFKLGADIDMKGVTGWIPVNYDQNYERKIHFDGANFTISNLDLSKQRDGHNYTSLFGVLYGSCKNLKIDNAKIQSTNGCGVIGGYIGTSGKPAVVENVSITNASVICSGQPVGGVGGTAYGATFKNVSYQGTVESTYRTTETDDSGKLKDGEGRVGGLIGMSRGEVLCEGCSVDASVAVHTENSNRTGHVGGCVGKVNDGIFIAKESTVKGSMRGTIYLGGFIGVVNSEVSLTSCTVESEIVATSSVGGLVGQYSPAGSGSMTSCVVKSKIKGENNVAGLVAIVETSSTNKFSMTDCSYIGEKIEAKSTTGGLVGNLNGEWVIKGSNVKTNITGTGDYFGGLIASCNGSTETIGCKVDISNCHFEGNVISTGRYIGGVIGVVQTKAKGFTMSNLSSKGSVEGTLYVGGAIGAAMCATSQSISDSWSESTVKAADQAASTYVKVGGFIGAITGAASVTGCHATGNVAAGTNCNAVGGLVGEVDAATTIEKCYATGNVSNNGGVHLGGLVGAAEANIEILKSYSTGNVTNSKGSNRAAGLIAYHKLKCVIENCYTTGNVSNTGQQNGGIVGYTNSGDAQLILTNCFASGNVGTGRGCAGILGNSQAAANKTSVVGCIAWNAEVTTNNRGTGNYAPAAVVGSCYNAGTFKNCWRRADMKLTDSANLSTLVDQDDLVGQLPYLTGAPSNAYNPNRAYQGKAAAADATISSVAKTIGWDETIWDLSGAVPVLK